MPGSPDDVLLRAFAAEVRQRRATLRISQEELAFRAKLNRTFVAKLELAKNQPTLTTLFQIAEGLEAAPSELIRAIEDRYEMENCGLLRN